MTGKLIERSRLRLWRLNRRGVLRVLGGLGLTASGALCRHHGVGAAPNRFGGQPVLPPPPR